MIKQRALFVAPFAALGLIFLPAPAEAAPLTPYDVQHGPHCVSEDDMICAPGNEQGVPAGCYDDGGVLEFEWPCIGWTPEDGYVHGDGTVTYPYGRHADVLSVKGHGHGHYTKG